MEQQREFTIEELAEYNGQNGKPVYVAMNGNVYDLSSKLMWAGGRHFGLIAGKDLSAQFQKCHFGRLSVLESLPVVGVLKNE